MSSEKLGLVELHQAGGYGSELEPDSEAERKRKRRHDLADKPKTHPGKLPPKEEYIQKYSLEESRPQRYHYCALDAYSRHKQLINNYVLFYGGPKLEDIFKRDSSRDRTDLDVIHENHRFLWTDEDNPDETWEKRLARKYYDKLFKEYGICDLSRFKEGKIAIRWRVEKEVMEGKGQFSCGDRKCNEKSDLTSWEVNFAYMEHEEKKNALVKLRLCPECSHKLNYRRKHKEAKMKRDKKKKTSVEDEEDEECASTSDPSKKPKVEEQESEKVAVKEQEEAIWKRPVEMPEEKSREEEFEEYLADLFM